MQPISSLGLPRKTTVEYASDFQNSKGNILFVLNSLEDVPCEFQSLLSCKSLEFPSGASGITRIIEIGDEKPQKLVFFFIKEYQGEWKDSLAELARTHTISGLYLVDTAYFSDILESVLLGRYKWNLLGQSRVEGDYSQIITFYGKTIIDKFNADCLLLSKTLRKVDSIILARDLTNLPPNYKTPKLLVEFIKQINWKSTSIQIIPSEEIDGIGMGLISAVAKGSDELPFVVILKQKDAIDTKFALVGKGVTFDAGGLQIKPDSGMADMKCDMAGAASVIASCYYFDEVGYPVGGVVGIVGLVENLVGPQAFKPSDVYTAFNGKKVEIGHTDAEGRLVLGDLLAYVVKYFSPNHIASIATLTGACIAALGYDYIGIMSTNDKFCQKCQELIEKTNESTWRLPLDKKMIQAVKCDSADLKNISPEMKAGSSMGGAFLTHFVPDSTSYIHLDIAGPAFRTKPSGIFPAGATGAGVESLIAIVDD